MILAGVLWGAANGNLSAVTQSLIDSAGAAVSLALTMLGKSCLFGAEFFR